MSIFISFEGADGSGKSSQARIAAEKLRKIGYDVVLTREPGGSSGAEQIRSLILQGDADRWSPETEILLFTAARRDHLERTILPALKRGAIVITDRYADSTRVYQGAARGDLRETVDALHRLMIIKEPDLTLLLDLEPEVGLARGMVRNGVIEAAGLDEGRFERMGLSFQQRLHQGFRELPDEFPERCVRIDADGDFVTVSDRIMPVILMSLSKQIEPSEETIFHNT